MTSCLHRFPTHIPFSHGSTLIGRRVRRQKPRMRLGYLVRLGPGPPKLTPDDSDRSATFPFVRFHRLRAGSGDCAGAAGIGGGGGLIDSPETAVGAPALGLGHSDRSSAAVLTAHGSLEGVGGLKTNEAYHSKADALLIPEM